MSDVILRFDKTDGHLLMEVNGQHLDGVAAVNLAVSRKGSICTVVFEAEAVDVQALIEQIIMGEEAPTEYGGN